MPVQLIAKRIQASNVSFSLVLPWAAMRFRMEQDGTDCSPYKPSHSNSPRQDAESAMAFAYRD